MSYIGRGIDQIDNISTLDNLSFNGSDATFNLTQNSVAFNIVSVDALQIQIDGIIQVGNFTQTGASQIQFDFTPNANSVCNSVKHFGVGLLSLPSDGSVNMAQLGASGTKSSSTFLAGDNSFKSLTTNATHTGEVTGSGALTVADNVIDEANLKVSNSPTNGYFLSAQSGNTGGLTWAEAGGSALEHIQSTSVTGTVSSTGFTGCFTSTYENYYFVFHNILNGIDDQPVYWRFKDTSGNVLSASEYDWVHIGQTTNHGGQNTSVVNSSQNDSQITLLKDKDLAGVGGNSNANKGYCHGIIFSPQKTSYASNDNQHCYMTWSFAFPRSTYLHTGTGSAVFTNGTALGGIQIRGGGGGGPNYTDRFEGSIYGIKRS